MRPLHLATCIALAAIVICADARGADVGAELTQRDQWMMQARAADALGEVLMRAAARAEAHVDAMRKQVADVGGARPMPTTRAATRPPPKAAYRELFDLVFTEARRADRIAARDPSLQEVSDAQLFDEMAALQSYNLRTFGRLSALRDQEKVLREQLASADAATTQPAIETPDHLAAEAIALLKQRRSRDPRWVEARLKLRNALAAAARNRALRDAAVIPYTPPPPAPSSRSIEGEHWNDPRWLPHYYGLDDPFTGWHEAFWHDPYTFRGGGGGFYRRFDQRVNLYHDTRTGGQSDRRVNIHFDRRLDVHFDPRENF